MQRTYRTIAPAMRAASLFGLLLLAAGGARAATQGSTDIYRNEFAASFGSGLKTSTVDRYAGHEDGSTDIWGNAFRASFGSSDPDAQPTREYVVGSTDIWGNGFHASFGHSERPIASDQAYTGMSSTKIFR